MGSPNGDHRGIGSKRDRDLKGMWLVAWVGGRYTRSGLESSKETLGGFLKDRRVDDTERRALEAFCE